MLFYFSQKVKALLVALIVFNFHLFQDIFKYYLFLKTL